MAYIRVENVFLFVLKSSVHYIITVLKVLECI